jgi:hypothetical protein
MIRAKDAFETNQLRLHPPGGMTKTDARILQLALGSRPISNPASLSADGPVGSDPESARGISAAKKN